MTSGLFPLSFAFVAKSRQTVSSFSDSRKEAEEGMFLFRDDESGPYAESRRYWKSVAALVAHLAGTAVLFTTFIVLAWLIGVIVHGLNGIHPFSPDVRTFIINVELGILWADTALCAIVLVAGIGKFCREILR